MAGPLTGMEHPYPSMEFEVEVGKDGALLLPRSLAGRFRPGAKITLRVTDGTVSASLRKRGVTEEEVERIATLQLEKREQAILFLSGQGVLASSEAFSRRASRLLGRRG
jgi:hypothetical protein